MRRVISLLGAVCVFLSANPALLALAANPGSGTTEEASNVTITVVLPEAAEETGREAEPAADETGADRITAYPSDVTETREGGDRQIIKTYDLNPGERPEDIPRADFERDGWRYTLTDIIRKETANAETRDHNETVTLNTDTKELEKILPLLAPTIEYKAEDGFVGILTLDVSTVKVETAGTKTSAYTMRVTREYPRLSGSDISLIPKTVTDKGKTYTLADVDWRSGNNETVDYSELPEYYTAVATYTATGTSTKVTGYTTTAVYGGTLAKLARGKTVYTAYFAGEEMRTPLEIVMPNPRSGADSKPWATPETPQADGEPDAEKPGAGAWLALIPALAILAGGASYLMKKRGERENAKVDNPAFDAADSDGGDGDDIRR
jgi:hypothetical protein